MLYGFSWVFFFFFLVSFSFCFCRVTRNTTFFCLEGLLETQPNRWKKKKNKKDVCFIAFHALFEKWYWYVFLYNHKPSISMLATIYDFFFHCLKFIPIKIYCFMGLCTFFLFLIFLFWIVIYFLNCFNNF